MSGKRRHMQLTQEVSERLKASGLRPTTVRTLILRTLIEACDHPSTDELFERIRKDGNKLGRATVYQNLERLVQAGLVREIAGEDGLKRYDGNLDSHQHMVCEESGRIIDVQVDPELLKSLRPLDPRTGKPIKDWEVDEVRVTFRVTPKSRKR